MLRWPCSHLTLSWCAGKKSYPISAPPLLWGKENLAKVKQGVVVKNCHAYNYATNILIFTIVELISLYWFSYRKNILYQMIPPYLYQNSINKNQVFKNNYSLTNVFQLLVRSFFFFFLGANMYFIY